MSNLNTTADVQQQEQDRLKKLAKIQALGFDPYGTRFENACPLAELRALGETLPLTPGGEPDSAPHRLAGRIVLLRDMGKLMFIQLRDDTGDLQVGISKKSIAEAEWQLCKELDLGDLIGVNGCLGRTKTGELTIWARIPENPLDGQPVDEQAAWDLAERKNAGHESVDLSAAETSQAPPSAQNAAVVLLCKSLLPPPAKEAAGGFADTDLRYRQRYIDLYANPSVMATFRKRFTLIKFLRDYLTQARTLSHPYGGFVEVETPMLQSIYGGAAARPFTTHHNTLDLDLFLRISPEIYLKRLLVGGLPRIFEINRNFRNEGISTKHNPEFTMMELYMAYGDYTDMMHITEGLIAGACRLLNQEQLAVEWNGRKVDFTPPWPRLHYGDLFQKHVGCDMFNAEAVRALARQKLPTVKDTKGQEKDYAILVGELFEAVVEPVIAHMDRPVFVLDYPAPLCPLTRRAPNDSRIALRFEAYVCGMEIANAYTELNDPAVQEENFRQQLEGEGDETMRVVDTDFIHALKAGMPPAGGLGIGIDRIVMLLTNSASIRDVILFPLQRPEK